MSFILDALKKSEAERQRQTGPTLLELRVTQPRRRYPGWVIAVALLLALNAGILLYVVVRRPPASPVATVLSPAPSAALPAPVVAPAAPAPPAVTPSAVTSSAVGTNPASAAVAPAISAVAPLVPASSAAAPGTAPPATGSAAASVAANPADDEPAVPATNSAAKPASLSPADYAALPSLSSLGNNVPALQLDLLDYSDLADERYALINMHRVREGDVLPEGPRVLAITRDGVAMAYNGQDFMLRSSGSTPP